MRYFLDNLNLYAKEVNSDDGILWVNKGIGFDKSKVLISQYALDIK
jgi:hypothetical protein